MDIILFFFCRFFHLIFDSHCYANMYSLWIGLAAGWQPLNFACFHWMSLVDFLQPPIPTVLGTGTSTYGKGHGPSDAHLELSTDWSLLSPKKKKKQIGLSYAGYNPKKDCKAGILVCHMDSGIRTHASQGLWEPRVYKDSSWIKDNGPSPSPIQCQCWIIYMTKEMLNKIWNIDKILVKTIYVVYTWSLTDMSPSATW